MEKCFFFFLKKKEKKKGPLISGSNAELYLESGNPLFCIGECCGYYQGDQSKHEILDLKHPR